MSNNKKQTKEKKSSQKTAEQEDLHSKMLEQLGLSHEEAQKLMPDIKNKVKGGKKSKKQADDYQEAVEQEPFDDMDDGTQRLTLGDLFESIDRNKMTNTKQTKNDEVINTNRLQKQLKELRKEAQTSALTAPLTGRKRLKIEREENYQMVKKHLGKWIPQVKQNRETDQLDFTTTDVIGEGGGVKLNSMNQIASNLREGQAGSKLESQIYNELKRQGISSEKDLKQKEFESLQGVDAKQLEQRYAQIAQMKSLLFRQELKNRRISKIKSKLYHKIKKREKDREEKKLLEYLEQIDPEAAEAYRNKDEQKKVEERLRLRHASNNKFGRKLKRFGGMDNEGVKDAFNDMMKEKNALKQRSKTVQKKTKNDSSSDEDDEDMESGSEQEESITEDDENALRKNAVSQIEKELMEAQQNEGSSDEQEDSDDDGLVMKFDSKSGAGNKKKQQQDKGIIGLKFMQRAEERKKEQLKEQAKMLIQQIQDEQEILKDDDDKQEFVHAKNKFSKKSLPVKEIPVQSVEKLRQAAAQLQNVEVKNDKVKTDEKPQEEKGKKSKKQNQQVEVSFDVKEDLKNFKTEQKKVIQISNSDPTLKNLFIAQDEERAMEDFEQEKEHFIENELGQKVLAPKVARGWDEWAGEGISENRYNKRVERAEQIKKQKIEELKAKRADTKLKGVVLNVEERDKKFAQKYWVKDLPHPYKNVKQFEALMNVPLGKDWNTIASHKRLIQPDVLTKAGTIIKPLKYKKEISLGTIDALVAHRQEKKEKRPAAKF